MANPMFSPRALETERPDAVAHILKDQLVELDFANFILGDLLGYGISRYVFDYNLDPKWVVKIDMSDSRHANVMEWHTWGRVQFVDGVSKWFAPCGVISQCGRIMLQRKCKPLKKHPEKLPTFLTDTKYRNYMSFNNHPVCVDYASHLLMEEGMKVRMRKVKWWG